MIGLPDTVQQIDVSDSLSVKELGLNDLVRSAQDVRESKIEQIQKDILNGTYNVKAEQIAEKIIEDDLLNEVFKI